MGTQNCCSAPAVCWLFPLILFFNRGKGREQRWGGCRCRKLQGKEGTVFTWEGEQTASRLTPAA